METATTAHHVYSPIVRHAQSQQHHHHQAARLVVGRRQRTQRWTNERTDFNKDFIAARPGPAPPAAPPPLVLLLVLPPLCSSCKAAAAAPAAAAAAAAAELAVAVDDDDRDCLLRYGEFGPFGSGMAWTPSFVRNRVMVPLSFLRHFNAVLAKFAGSPKRDWE